MKLDIRGPQGFDTLEVKQTLMFYISRFEFSVDSLKLEVNHLKPVGGNSSYRIQLDSRLAGGQTVKFEETQSDVKLAMQRLMDRLERHLNRRKGVDEQSFLDRGVR